MSFIFAFRKGGEDVGSAGCCSPPPAASRINQRRGFVAIMQAAIIQQKETLLLLWPHPHQIEAVQQFTLPSSQGRGARTLGAVSTPTGTVITEVRGAGRPIAYMVMVPAVSAHVLKCGPSRPVRK